MTPPSRRAVAVVATACATVMLAACGDDGGSDSDADGSSADAYVGYWAGVDPLDGGDSRRGITENDDGTFSIVGRDTVFTLCDDTDRAIVTTDDATIEDDTSPATTTSSAASATTKRCSSTSPTRSSTTASSSRT